MESDADVITQTRTWILKVVVGCNFCPFAAGELKQNTIHFEVVRSDDPGVILQSLSAEFDRLDNNAGIQTSLLILPGFFSSFNDYLDIIGHSEKFLRREAKEGIYQIASFHPEYLFAGSSNDDPANYTNRSLYPMIHLLRESSITAALATFPDPGEIPLRNIGFANQKGLAYMKVLRDACLLPGQ
jgi:hypothetical protein